MLRGGCDGPGPGLTLGAGVAAGLSIPVMTTTCALNLFDDLEAAICAAFAYVALIDPEAGIGIEALDRPVSVQWIVADGLLLTFEVLTDSPALARLAGMPMSPLGEGMWSVDAAVPADVPVVLRRVLAGSGPWRVYPEDLPATLVASRPS